MNNIEYHTSFNEGIGYILVLVPLTVVRVYDLSLKIGRCPDRYII